MPDIAGDQSRSVNFDEMSFGEHTERPIGAGEEPGDRRFTGARIAGKNQMEGQSFGVQVILLPELSNPHKI
jgi:hypothetical protein